MRNIKEKTRRDKLNMYISELSTLVPMVATATKRVDKTSVLRLSANFLRIHRSLKQAQPKKEDSKTNHATVGLEAQLSSVLLDSMESFMMIVSSSGKIIYVSETVEKLLGHSQLDLMGQSLYTFCHYGDVELLRHHLLPSKPYEPKDNIKDLTESGIEYVPRSPSFYGGKPEDAMSGLSSGERRSFYIRLAERTMATRSDPTQHITVHMIGVLRPPANKRDQSNANKGKDCPSTMAEDEHLLACVVRPFRKQGIRELSLMEAIQDEYVTRHLPDGRIIYSDHRIAFVAGYLTEEVMGMSAFNFIHQDDLPWATVANRQMFSHVEGQGYSVYRLRAKTGTLIYLRTRGYLEFNKTTQKVESFVCINTLLTSEEGDKELEKERERILPFITFQQATNTSTNVSSSKYVLPAIQKSAVTDESVASKIITTLTATTENPAKKLKFTSTTETVSSILPCSNVAEITDISSPNESANAISLITSPELLLSGYGEILMNGDSLMDIQEPIQVESVPLISAAQMSTISMAHYDTTIRPPFTPTISPSFVHRQQHRTTRRDIISTGLKRPYSEVDDVVVTSSAKGPIVPTAFIP